MVSEVDEPPPRPVPAGAPSGGNFGETVVPAGFRSTLPAVPPPIPAGHAGVLGGPGGIAGLGAGVLGGVGAGGGLGVGTGGVGGVPEAVVSSFQRLTGVDLGFVPLVRSAEVGRAAAQMGARAYTSGGAVHLPPDAGSLDRAETHALLGHELAHVAQQRALGQRASESGPHGAGLEAAAQAAERAMRGETSGLPMSLLGGLATSGGHGPTAGAPSGGMAGGTSGGQGTAGDAGLAGLSWTPDGGFSSVASLPPLTSTSGTSGTGGTNGTNGASGEAQRAPLSGGSSDDVWSSDDLPDPTPALVPPEPPDPDEPVMSTAELTAAIARIEHRLAELAASQSHGASQSQSHNPGQRPGQHDGLSATEAEGIAKIVARQLSGHYVALNDSTDLDALAIRLYDRFRTQMRTELLLDRERSGLLTDFR